MRLSDLIRVSALAGAFACVPVGNGVPTAVPNTDFELAVGSSARIEGSELSLKFENVTEDSRCPTDVQCVWEGNATMVFSADSSGRTRPFELRTAGTPPPASVFGRLVEFRGLRPRPTSSSRPVPRDYVVTLRVR